jgi:hypothetical protein
MDVEQAKREHMAPPPELIWVTRETFERLPRDVRAWYARRVKLRNPMPSELAMRCLLNDCIRYNYGRGGEDAVDGRKPLPEDLRNAMYFSPAPSGDRRTNR